MTTATETAKEITFEWVTEAPDPETRVERFLALLETTKSKLEISQYCSELYQWHRARYKGKNGEPGRVRSAIANLTTTRRAISKIPVETLPKFAVSHEKGNPHHYALDCLVMSDEDHKLKEQSEQIRSSQKRSRMKASEALDLGALVEKATEMLNSSKSAEIALGLAIVTGRRMVEICVTGKFTADGTYSFQFSGQAKGSELKKQAKGLFPCLIDSRVIEEAVERLRKLEPPSQFGLEKIDNPEKAFNDSSLRKRIDRTFKKLISPLFDDAKFKDKDSAHKLRAAYCLVIIQKSIEKHGADTEAWEYAKQCLGHESVATTREYNQLKVKNIPSNFDLDLDIDEVGFWVETLIEKQSINAKDSSKVDSKDGSKDDSSVVTLEEIYLKLDPETQAEIATAIKKGQSLVDVICKALMAKNMNEIIAANKPRKNDALTGIGQIVDAIMVYNLDENNSTKQLYITKALVSRIHRIVKGKDISSQSWHNYLKSNESKVNGHNSSIVNSDKNNLAMRGQGMVEAVDKIVDIYSKPNS